MYEKIGRYAESARSLRLKSLKIREYDEVFLQRVVDAEACSVAVSLLGTRCSGLTQGATSLSEKLV